MTYDRHYEGAGARYRARLIPAAVLVALLFGLNRGGAVGAEGFGAPPDRFLHLVWAPNQTADGHTIVEGYIYNDRPLWAERVHVFVDTQNASGLLVRSVVRPLLGDVPPLARLFFRVAVAAPGASYRVDVQYVFWWEPGM
jgi:hypothetical protein